MQLFNQPPRTSYQPIAIPDDVPVYRIKEGKFFADDELYEAGSIIAWDEEPNMEMQPLNDLAKLKFFDYIDKLDTHGRETAKAAGKAYVSLASAFENANALAKKEGRRVGLLNGNDEVPIMGGSKRTRAPKAQRIESSNEEVRLESNNKHSLNSPKAVNNISGV